MTTNIYVNNNNSVETYLLNVNLEKLKDLQKRIDNWHGKGEVKVQRGCYLKDQGNEKVEILSQKQIDWGLSKCDYFYNQSKVPVYIFRYKAYKPHFLSNICEAFLSNKDTLNYSFYLKELLSYKPTGKKERKYYYEILSCFLFQKYELETLIESDIDLTNKKSILTKLKEIIVKSKENEEKHFLPQSYINIINNQIALKEYFSSSKRYRTIRYSTDYKNQIKKKRLLSLPKKSQFEKHFSTN